jgi:hypothetical protein
MRSFTVPWIPHDDVITPQDIQGVRGFGVADAADSLATVTRRRFPFSGIVFEEYNATVRRDPESPQGEGRPLVGIVAIEVRKSEIALPAKNGVFAVAGTNYTVLDRPLAGDPDGLIWILIARHFPTGVQ